MTRRLSRACAARLPSSAGVLAILLTPGIVFAQETPQDAATQAPSGGDIVVTATRRAEAVSKVPLSITAYSQEALDQRGVRSIQDVVNQTPGVDLSRTGAAAGQNRLIIRGIDSTAGAATSAMYIDDTPIQARNSSLNYNGSTVPYIFDIDRVEVLRGPQGTLFGASSEGGAVRFITPTPSLTDFSVYSRAAVNVVQGGAPGYELGAAVGAPIIKDKLALRVSAYYRRDGGWIDRQSWEDQDTVHHNVNSTETFVGRAVLRWAPTDWLTVTPSLYYQNIKADDQTPLWSRCPATTGSPGVTINPWPQGASDPSSGRFISYSPEAQPSRDRFWLPAAKFEADLGFATLTSVSSWFDRHVADVNDATNNNARVYFGSAYLFPVTPTVDETIGTQTPNIYQRSFTQEVRLTGGDAQSRIRYTLGGYYARSRVYTDLPITLPTYADLYLYRFGVAAPAAKYMVGDAIYYGRENTIERELSIFANVDLKLTDRLTLTAGARYSHNRLDFNVVESGVSYAAYGGTSTVQGFQRSRPLLPKASLAFQATRDALYYATYAQGYRTGGVNKTLPSTCTTEANQLGLNAATYNPDKTRSWELGTKNRLLGGAIRYEASLFYTKWDNIQQQLRLNCAFSLVTNTGSATSKGFDLNLSVKPMRDLALGLAVGYVEASYDQTIALSSSPVTVAGQTIGATPWTVNASAEYNFSRLAHAPYVRVQYNLKTANKGLYMWQVASSTTYDPTRPLPEKLETVDARGGLSFGPAQVSLYVENLFDAVSYLNQTPAYAQSVLVKGMTNRPRTYGLQLITRY